MNKRKLKVLFAVLAATLVITGVNYTTNGEMKTVHGAEIEAESKENIEINVVYTSEEFTNAINPSIFIINNSDEPLNLEDLNLKYFGACEDGTNQVADIYYSGITKGEFKDFTSNVKLAVIESDDNYDKHLEISFDDGILGAGESMCLQLGIHKEDWAGFKGINKENLSISGYKDGKLVYGEEKSKAEQKQPEQVTEPEISEEIVDYIPGFDEDVKVHVKLNGNKLLGITAESLFSEKAFKISEGKDYLIKYNKYDDYIVILKEEALKDPDGLKFDFNFSNGYTKTLDVSMMYPMLPWGTTLGITGGTGECDDSLESIISVHPQEPMDFDDEDSVNYIDSYSLTISYDEDQVTPESVVELGESINNKNFSYEIDDEKGTIYVKGMKKLISSESDLKLCKVTFKSKKGKREAESEIGASTEITLNGEKTRATGVSGKIKFKEFNPYLDMKIPTVCRIDVPVDSEGNILDNSGSTCIYDGNDLKVLVYSKDNTFEGIEGLEEGIDYIYDGDKTLNIKSSALEKFENEDVHYFTFKFDNNIKKLLAVNYNGACIPEHFNVSIGDKEARSAQRNNVIMVPIRVSNNVGDILTKCDFNLKYDTDVFKDAYVVCSDEKVKSSVDSENGVVNVTYDRQDPELSADKIAKPIYGNQIELYLALQLRDHPAFGDTVIAFEDNNGFEIRNSFDGCVVANNGFISVEPY